MNIGLLVEATGGHFATVAPTDTIKAAAVTLNRQRVGAALALDGAGALAGILSERDIVRAVGTHGSRMLGLPVSDVMTRSVRTCSPDDSVDTVLGMMNTLRVRHMPVMRDGRVIGLLDVRDLLAACVQEHASDAQAMKYFARLRQDASGPDLRAHMMTDR